MCSGFVLDERNAKFSAVAVHISASQEIHLKYLHKITCTTLAVAAMEEYCTL